MLSCCQVAFWLPTWYPSCLLLKYGPLREDEGYKEAGRILIGRQGFNGRQHEPKMKDEAGFKIQSPQLTQVSVFSILFLRLNTGVTATRRGPQTPLESTPFLLPLLQFPPFASKN